MIQLLSKTLFISLLFILIISCTQKQTTITTADTAIVKSQIRAQFNSLAIAAKNLDVNSYLSFIDKDKFTGLKVDGTNWNHYEGFKIDIVTGFSFIKKVHSLKFPNVKISVVNAETAVLTNEYIQVFSLNDGAKLTSKGGGTQVWSKASGKWLLISISASFKP
ncbi:nuclear transport factor 2 family protein [Kangiella sp. HZ709]|uniref:nuclear transport factor 2 family protein n=1 Tax=Kangiella sp. HZ709 TaxID=2666328 RepID=UPI0012B0D251|nr:nuclear transport factor 2 family protein [Kangiella sp. HZ709]MRX28135.1 hypothetical protein [Kangiella sp. HZ709]